MKKIFNTASVIVLLLFITINAAAQTDASVINIALTGFDNMEEEDQHDYLSALISALVREDLSNTEGISMLDRSSMAKILEEQKLQISGLFDDRTAVKAGKLLGSDYLIGGSYIVLDTEVLLDVTLINVETGRVVSFSNRGNSEDIIHLAGEKIARELTGKIHVFRTADSGRTIIKSTLLPPGKLRFFSHLIDARIYIDDEFYGYTPGDSVIPVEIELQPGIHRIKTDLGHDFGVVIEPEILFSKWEEEFEIKSGKTTVIEDGTRHFNSRLYDIQKVLRDSKTLYHPGAEPFSNQYDYNFTDRKGIKHDGTLTVFLNPTETGGLNAQIMIRYDYQRKVWDIECPREESVEFEKSIDLIDFSIDIDSRYINRSSASWSIWRNDVYQGLHREETERN